MVDRQPFDLSYRLIPPIGDPRKEAPLELREYKAKKLADLYSMYYKPGPNRKTVDEYCSSTWSDLLSNPIPPKRDNRGVRRMNELLELSLNDGVENNPSQNVVEKHSLSDATGFLLDLFKHADEITATDIDGRITEICTRLAFKIFGNSQGRAGNAPDPDRIRSMDLFFTHEPLWRAVEFFMIEPMLLPQPPEQKTS